VDRPAARTGGGKGKKRTSILAEESRVPLALPERGGPANVYSLSFLCTLADSLSTAKGRSIRWQVCACVCVACVCGVASLGMAESFGVFHLACGVHLHSIKVLRGPWCHVEKESETESERKRASTSTRGSEREHERLQKQERARFSQNHAHCLSIAPSCCDAYDPHA